MRFFRRRHTDDFTDRRSIGSWFNAPFRYVFQSLGGPEEELGQSLPWHRRLIRLILAIVWFPFFILLQFVVFIVMSWTTTRNGKAALWGIPIFLILLIVVGAVFLSVFFGDKVAIRTHREGEIEFAEAEDYETTLVCLSRLLNIRAQDHWRFRYAKAVEQLGDKQHYYGILGQLAPEDFPRHLDSHYEYAEDYLRKVANSQSSESLSESDQHNLAKAKIHFDHCITLDKDFGPARLRMATILRRQGNTADAMREFERFAESVPGVVPDLAKFLIEQDQGETADFYINRAIRNLRQMAAANPQEPGIWDQMYRVYMVKEDYEGANVELEMAVRRSDVPAVQARIKKIQSDLFVRVAESFAGNQTQDSFRRRLLAISKAVGTYHRNGLALSALIDLAIYPENEQTNQWLLDEMRQIINPSITHIVLGTRDCIHGKPNGGKNHFTLAFGGDPRTSIIVNDIAWMIGMVKNKYEDALRLADVAIDTWPETTQLYQTRAEVLMKLERFDEALTEIEFAAKSIKNDVRLYEIWATCLDKLNRPDEANKQREIANQFKQVAQTSQQDQ